MSNDKNKEIEYLKKLIRYGDKLKVDTFKYKKELNRLDKTTILKNKTKSVLTKTYSIVSVVQSQNSITVNFDKKIDIRKELFKTLQVHKKNTTFFIHFT